MESHGRAARKALVEVSWQKNNPNRGRRLHEEPLPPGEVDVGFAPQDLPSPVGRPSCSLIGFGGQRMDDHSPGSGAREAR